MCLSVPAKIISKQGANAIVEVYNQSRSVHLTMPDAEPGDWVLIYGPVALTVIDEKEAKETLALLESTRNSNQKPGN